ncbi:MAG: hypothetical protein ACYC0T_17705 [Ramlibacter sp.]
MAAHSTDGLLVQELAEANEWLGAFDEARTRASFYLGGGAFTAVLFPLIWAIFAWLGSSAKTDLALLAAVLPVGFVALGLWWRWRASAAFCELQVRCGKLERAGFRLCWKAAGLLPRQLSVAAATEGSIDFDRLTPRQVHAQRHAL